MFCPKCGIKLTDDAVFCPECGERIAKQDSDVPPNDQPSGSNEEKIKIEYVIDTEQLKIIFVWVVRLFSILSNLALIFLAFDFDKIRKEYIGLMLFSKEERLEQYFDLFFIGFRFSQWTMLFAVCFIILLIIYVILAKYIKKQGLQFEGLEWQPMDKEINLLIEGIGTLCTIGVWLWVLI